MGLPPAADGRKVKREMNNNDELYAQVRSLNFGELGPLLKKLARGVHEGYEERHAAHTVSQVTMLPMPPSPSPPPPPPPPSPPPPTPSRRSAIS